MKGREDQSLCTLIDSLKSERSMSWSKINFFLSKEAGFQSYESNLPMDKKAERLAILLRDFFQVRFKLWKFVQICRMTRTIEKAECLDLVFQKFSKMSQSKDPTWQEFLAEIVLEKTINSGQALFALYLLDHSRCHRENLLKHPRRLIYVHGLAVKCTQILTRQDKYWSESIIEVCEDTLSFDHRIAISNALIQASKELPRSLEFQYLWDWLITRGSQYYLLSEETSRTLIERVFEYTPIEFESLEPREWNGICDILYFHLSNTSVEELATSQQVCDLIRHYVEFVTEPEDLDYLDHVICLNLIRELCLLIAQALRPPQAVIHFSKQKSSAKLIRNLKESSWSSASCQKLLDLIDSCFTHPKWEYMIATNLRLGDDIKNSILAAQCLNINIFWQLLELCYRYPKDAFIWKSIVDYNDPWMQLKYCSFLENQIEQDTFKDSSEILDILKSIANLESQYSRQTIEYAKKVGLYTES